MPLSSVIPTRILWRDGLASLHVAFFSVLPLYFIGVVALVLAEVPFEGYRSTMVSIFGAGWTKPLRAIHDAIIPLISLALATAAGYTFAKLWGARLDPNLTLMAAIVSPLVLCAIDSGATLMGKKSSLATHGVPLAIVIGILSAWLISQLAKYFSRWIGDFDFALPIRLSTAIAAGVGATILFVLVQIVDQRLVAWSPSVANWAVEQIAATRSEYVRIVAYSMLVQVVWAIGMHGNNTWVWAFNRMLGGDTGLGTDVPNLDQSVNRVATGDFYNLYVSIGGTGATLGLLLAIFYVTHRRSGSRRIAKISTPTAIFQVNEPLLFGLPVILNPVLLVPFFLVPIALCSVAYTAVILGWVPVGTRTVHWAMPIFLNVHHAGIGLPGALLQIVCLTVSFLIYLPFVRRAERLAVALNADRMHRLESTLLQNGGNAEDVLRNSANPDWRTAREMLSCFIADTKDGTARIAYQPRVRNQDHIVGFEALARWEHPFFVGAEAGVYTALAEASDQAEWFAEWTLRISMTQLANWRALGYTDLKMSVNLSVSQFTSKRTLMLVQQLLDEHKIPPACLEIELTERDFPRETQALFVALDGFQKLGVGVALDDFGMGTTSLSMIRRYQIKNVKLDRVLVFDVDTNHETQTIVRSLGELFREQGIRGTAEHVETVSQRDTLQSLGFHEWQGFLFSKALTPEACLELLSRYAAHRQDTQT